jgi:hypothetical protein
MDRQSPLATVQFVGWDAEGWHPAARFKCLVEGCGECRNLGIRCSNLSRAENIEDAIRMAVYSAHNHLRHAHGYNRTAGRVQRPLPKQRIAPRPAS